MGARQEAPTAVPDDQRVQKPPKKVRFMGRVHQSKPPKLREKLEARWHGEDEPAATAFAVEPPDFAQLARLPAIFLQVFACLVELMMCSIVTPARAQFGQLTGELSTPVGAVFSTQMTPSSVPQLP